MPTLYLQSIGGEFDYSQVAERIKEDFCFENIVELSPKDLQGNHAEKRLAIIDMFKTSLKDYLTFLGDRLVLYIIDDEITKRKREHEVELYGVLLEAGKSYEEIDELMKSGKMAEVAERIDKYPTTMGIRIGYYPFVGICLLSDKKTWHGEQILAVTEHELDHTFMGYCNNDCVGNCCHFMVKPQHELCGHCREAIKTYQNFDSLETITPDDIDDLINYLSEDKEFYEKYKS